MRLGDTWLKFHDWMGKPSETRCCATCGKHLRYAWITPWKNQELAFCPAFRADGVQRGQYVDGRWQATSPCSDRYALEYDVREFWRIRSQIASNRKKRRGSTQRTQV